VAESREDLRILDAGYGRGLIYTLEKRPSTIDICTFEAASQLCEDEEDRVELERIY